MTPGDSFYLYSIGTVSSAGLERCLDRAEVASSNLARFTFEGNPCLWITFLFFNWWLSHKVAC